MMRKTVAVLVLIGAAAFLFPGVWAFFWRDALLVALLGGTVGATAHFVSHVFDRDLGGRATDPLALGVVAATLVVALALWPKARDAHEATKHRG